MVICRYYFERLTNTTTNASTVITFAPSFNPFGNAVKPLVASVREILDDVEGTNIHEHLSAHFYHPMVVEVDAEAFVFARLPWVLLPSPFPSVYLLADVSAYLSLFCINLRTLAKGTGRHTRCNLCADLVEVPCCNHPVHALVVLSSTSLDCTAHKVWACRKPRTQSSEQDLHDNGVELAPTGGGDTLCSWLVPTTMGSATPDSVGAMIEKFL